MLYDLDATEQANKAALLLVHSRYSAQYAPFVQGKLARLSYVQERVFDLVERTAEEVGADVDWVREHFDEFLKDSMHSQDIPGVDGIEHTDVMERGEVAGAGIEEALKPDERQSLSEYTKSGKKLSKEQIAALKEGLDVPLDPAPVVDAEQGLENADVEEQIGELQRRIEAAEATNGEDVESLYAELGRLVVQRNRGQANPVEEPEFESRDDMFENQDRWSKRADAAWAEDMAGGMQGVGTGASDPEPPVQPLDPSAQFKCALCERAGVQTQGTEDELMYHVQQEHADEVARANQAPSQPGAQPLQQPLTSVKEAEVPRTDDEAPRAEPLPATPADEFDSYVQELAEAAAARKYSLPDDAMIHSIASQIGQPPEDVRNRMVAVAIFGNHTAVNGEEGNSNPPEGYTEVSAQGVGGRIDAAEALVPTNLVVTKVAEKMNMQEDLAMQMIRDRYGADLPDKYHASVAGEVHLYLPPEMAQAAPNMAPDPEVGPTPQPAQQTPVQPNI
jgi:hypothetical protein